MDSANKNLTADVTHDPKTGRALERDDRGRMVNEAAWRRAHAARRAELVAALGWEPEDGTAGGRYVYTGGELASILRERA